MLQKRQAEPGSDVSCLTRVQVRLHPKHTSAIVVFAEPAGTAAALAAGKKSAVIEFPIADEDAGPSEGLRGMVEAHKASYPGNGVLQKQLDDWMVEFEQEEERKRVEAENAAAEDGWTVVTKGAGRKRKSGACSDAQQVCGLSIAWSFIV